MSTSEELYKSLTEALSYVKRIYRLKNMLIATSDEELREKIEEIIRIQYDEADRIIKRINDDLFKHYADRMLGISIKGMGRC